MKKSIKTNITIVEYKNNKLYLTDGNHRYSALKN